MSRGNLASLLDAPARRLRERPAILVGDEPVCSWAGLAESTARRAGGLRERLGVRPGDAIAFFAENHADFIAALFSVWHAGAVAVPISARLHPREAADLIAASHSRACFVTADLAGPLAEHVPDGFPIVALGDADDAALAAADPVAIAPRALDDDAWIFFTSGTTGRAKGARLSHGNLFAMTAAYYADVASVDEDDAIIHVAALTHASGLIGLPYIARGAAQVLPPSGGFDPGELLDLAGAHARSSFFVPPVLLRRLCAAPQVGEARIDRLGVVIVGAAPVLPSDLRTGVATLGPCLWNGYGQGESPCTITAMSRAAIARAVAEDDEARLGSVGVARLGMRVRVAGDDDGVLGPGEVGEVVVQGPCVMSGYLDLPEATAEALRGGWLHTGDAGHFDETGHLTLVDRVKDMLISGGYNVYPREVEDVLLLDPAVHEVAVIGVPDAEWGERVVAYLVAAPGAALDTAELDARCIDAIARHKRPKEYVEVGELPRNAAGKVLKKELRASHAAAGEEGAS